MKCLYILLLSAVSAIQAVTNIPAPTVVQLTALDPPGFKVVWTPVESLDESDPIVGYKVNVWKQLKKQVYHYEIKDGEKVLVTEEVPEEFTHKIPDWQPEVITVIGAKESSAEGRIDTKNNYEIRVQAYTSKRDGPHSGPVWIKLD